MRKLSDEQKAELRASILELAECCPVTQCNPKDCPLFSLRKMAKRKRLRLLKALTEDDLAFLAAYHHICLTTKVES